jgi:hypothetical protein
LAQLNGVLWKCSGFGLGGSNLYFEIGSTSLLLPGGREKGMCLYFSQHEIGFSLCFNASKLMAALVIDIMLLVIQGPI